MASLRDIRKHISSIKSIKQITYAMKMVAVARIKKAQNSMLSARPFAIKMDSVIADLYSEMQEADFKKSSVHDLFENENDAKSVGLVLITSDKGLCGSFNANLIKKTLGFIRANKDKKIYFISVGKKGRDFVRRIKRIDLEFYYEMFGIFPKVGYIHSNLVSENVIKMYREKKLSRVVFIYNEFKSMIQQNLVEQEFLPLEKHILSRAAGASGISDFDFEPGKMRLMENLIPRHISSHIYRILLESQAAELSARMNAMESASKNAAEIIDELTLKMNKTRQAMITTELNEIVSGASALES
ncbi:MAG: ATP synthase F1 subunit gamma [Elusimicrobia bacterium CG08_land_8_20_14_0_20_51_18]|nr:MAG: ATP synthase F1 subunit gamma [Elusimicrobia bacterium CG08_land_8_20_14_0_20_51_18]